MHIILIWLESFEINEGIANQLSISTYLAFIPAAGALFIAGTIRSVDFVIASFRLIAPHVLLSIILVDS